MARRPESHRDLEADESTIHHLTALNLIRPAPDAMGFLDLNGVTQTLSAHLTSLADRLGVQLSKSLFLLALRGTRRKEHLCVWSTTRSQTLPLLYELEHAATPQRLDVFTRQRTGTPAARQPLCAAFSIVPADHVELGR